MVSLDNLPDSVIVGAAQMFLDNKKAEKIRDWVNKQIRDLHVDRGPITREQVFPLVRIANKRDFLLLAPPVEVAMRDRVVSHFGLDANEIRVSGVRGVLDHVAAGAAQAALESIQQLAEKRKTIHFGVGGGWTTMLVARHLAPLLRTAERLPKKLVIHALSTGFDVERPKTAPVSFFSFFDHLPIKVECIGLFASAMVRSQDYQKTLELPGVKRAFELMPARGFDLVITSLGDASHVCGDFNTFMRIGSEEGLEVLRRAGWVGDVQYRPYSADGPILADTFVRAVTLLELEDLVALAKRPDKHVIVAAGPCMVCGKSRSKAVHPLLTSQNLKLWTRMVMDATTAEDLLGMPSAA